MFSSSTSMRYIDSQLREHITYKLAELYLSCVITTSQRPIRCFVVFTHWNLQNQLTMQHGWKFITYWITWVLEGYFDIIPRTRGDPSYVSHYLPPYFKPLRWEITMGTDAKWVLKIRLATLKVQKALNQSSLDLLSETPDTLLPCALVKLCRGCCFCPSLPVCVNKITQKPLLIS